jgi:hypothetical protein
MQLRPIQARSCLEILRVRGLLLCGRVGAGKALANDTPVATPRGWVPIQALRVGDFVIDSTGQATPVLGVFPQGLRPCFEVRFSDGHKTICDQDHLWTFRMRQDQWITQTAAAWAITPLRRKCGGHHAHRVFAPILAGPATGLDQALPLDPYTLGALLGDGGLGGPTPSFTSMDPDIVSRLRLPQTVKPRLALHQHSGKALQYNLTCGNRGGAANPLTVIFKELGLWGKLSKDKHIPTAYLSSATSDRLDLLRGLLDTDGSVAAPERIEFGSMSQQLVCGVRELIESLGGVATLGPGHAGSFRVRGSIPEHVLPFYCSRKVNTYRSKGSNQRTPYRAVVSIAPVESRECTCIRVGASDGLFAIAGHVLTHNTLTAGLAARLLDLKRPLLVTDASVVGDTRKLLDRYRQHWHIPPINVISYHKISNRSTDQRARIKRGEDPGPGFLDRYDADGVLLDEVHRLKRVKDAACARRFARWFHERPAVPVCGFSGTPVRDSFRDYAHIVVWCLKHGAPVPLDPDVQDEWALLLDDEKPTREGYTALPSYEILSPHLGPVADRESAREAFQRRMIWTPGIVVSQDSFEAVPLTIEPIKLETPDVIDPHWRTLRELWEAPDGWTLPDKQLGVWNVANQLALGFYYRHVPRPPKDWADARREWCRFCREILEASSTLDTEVDVRNACLAGRLPRQAWDPWSEIRDSYTPDKVPEWLSLHAVHAIEAWGRKHGPHGAIVWSNYTALGQALAERAGWPFFGPGGKDSRGRLVGDARSDVDPVIIVSTKVAEVGKNLQGDEKRPGYARNLFTTPPRAAADWEQRIGRTHRDGQAHAVRVDYLVGCLENFVAMFQSKALASMSEKSLMPSQKLLRWTATEPPIAWAKGPAYGEIKEMR